jgi:coenzyme F420-reducing hydrogenase beta subunit
VSVCHKEERNLIETSPEVYAAYTKDEGTLNNSSSGGIFREIATCIINKGGVVYGAAFSDAYTVQHIAVETLDDIWRLQGSKYLQSNIGKSYSEVKQHLEEGRSVLFAGTPCQVSGLKKYLGKDYDELLTLDIVCHGVPSPAVWIKYVHYIEKRSASKVNRVNFRDKKHGWKKYSVCFDFDDGKQYRKAHNEDLFMRGFLADIYLRPSCYTCKYKIDARISDFTLGDFWGIQHICPQMENKNGTSLCVLNTEKSKHVWNSIKSEIVYESVNLDDALKYNAAAVSSPKRPQTREKFFEILETHDFGTALKKVLPKQKIYRKILRKIKRIFK